MRYASSLCLGLIANLLALSGFAETITVAVEQTTYRVDTTTLSIEAQTPQGTRAVMPALYAPFEANVSEDKDGWHWQDSEGRAYFLSTEGDALHLLIKAPIGTKLSWSLPPVKDGTWLVPDGEGMAYEVRDTYWREKHDKEHCLGGTTALSFPAWSYLTRTEAMTYALGDGFKSKFCLKDNDGLQARLTHQFEDGSETLDLLFASRPPVPLAPALFYRKVIQARGQLKTFADKPVSNLSRLYGASHAYVWGDGRDIAFLNALKSLGIQKMVLSYDQDPRTNKHLVTPAYNRKAFALGYLSGPYDAFDNGQAEKTADMPSALWGDLYPSGCLIDKDGKVVSGFGNRGCQMSSEAIARHRTNIPAARYAQHIKDGASQVFIDTEAFGTFYDDFSPDHPMTMAKDRLHRLERLGLGINTYDLVLGSEHVTAWSSGVTHYSHGTGQAHSLSVWPLLKDKRFGGYWPPERIDLFFYPFVPTPDEARALFGPSDRLPLFEAVYHDSVVALDRWEFGVMKVSGLERQRYARSLLYGIPLMWNLDQRELKRVSSWLKSSQDAFLTIHGDAMPVEMTGFAWLTDDRFVQETQFADGRKIVANFGASPWEDLMPECVRVTWPEGNTKIFCPPSLPVAYRR